MRYEADHKEKTRQRVLKEAAKAIREEGPHRVAVAEVMAKAGLTVGGFYAHFRSRDDLVAQAIDQMFAEGRKPPRAGLSPKEALAADIDSYLSSDHRDARDYGCPLPYLAADLPRLTDAARDRFAAGAAKVRARIAGKLMAIGAPDPDAQASSVLSEMVGAVALARAEPEPTASDAILERSRVALRQRLRL